MFNPPNEQDKPVSYNQTPEAKSAEKQPAVPGFAIDTAKVQREVFRGLGNLFKAVGLDSTPFDLHVKKTRLFEALVEQHKSDIQKELGITLKLATHWADIEKYAEQQGYLGDISHMSEVEGKLKTNVLRGPKLVLSNSAIVAQVPPTPPVESKEAVEAVQKSSGTPQAFVVEKQADPVVIDHQRTLRLIEAFREKELANFDPATDTVESVTKRIFAYEALENKTKQRLEEQRLAEARAIADNATGKKSNIA